MSFQKDASLRKVEARLPTQATAASQGLPPRVEGGVPQEQTLPRVSRGPWTPCCARGPEAFPHSIARNFQMSKVKLVNEPHASRVGNQEGHAPTGPALHPTPPRPQPHLAPLYCRPTHPLCGARSPSTQKPLLAMVLPCLRLSALTRHVSSSITPTSNGPSEPHTQDE